MRKLITILILLAGTHVSATTYYVSNTGNDAATGTSAAQAWQTISKVNTFNGFNPGDNILFKGGDVWREELTVSTSGSFGNPITFGVYGTGVRPRILGSNLAASWTNMGGDVWQASGTFTNPDVGDGYPGTIYFTTTTDTSWGIQKADTASLTAPHDWCWVSNKIYIYSTVSPAILYQQIEVTQRKVAINLNSKNYLAFDGLNIQFASNSGIQGGPGLHKKGLLIQNCNVSYIGIRNGGAAYGIQANYSDYTVQDCIIHSNGRRGISVGNITAYDTVQNILFQRNHLYDGYHTTGFDIQSNEDGIMVRNITIKDNVIEDSADKKISGYGNYQSVLVFISEQSHADSTTNTGTGTVRDITIANNLLKYPSGNALSIDNAVNVNVSNNTFIVGNTNTTNSQGVGVSVGSYAPPLKTDSVHIRNNIFKGEGASWLVFVDDGGIKANGLFSDYNLYYQTTPSVYSICWENGFNYFTGADIDGWKSFSGQDTHSIVADPLLDSEYNITDTSPALSAGTDVGYGANIGATMLLPVVPPVAAGDVWPTRVPMNFKNE